MDGIFGFEKELITLAAESGVDGFHFGDDWGTQETTILSPEMWKRTFKRRYKEQFDYAHSLGLHVWFHSCGNIGSLIGELHDLKVDVINVAQPNVVDIEGTCGPLKGKQCFLLPVAWEPGETPIPRRELKMSQVVTSCSSSSFVLETRSTE